jgi:hypothetical protein
VGEPGFLSKGPISATATIDGKTMSIVADAGGNVFGQGDPGGHLPGTLTGSGWSAGVTNHPSTATAPSRSPPAAR